jgi:hypothetical protein
VPGGARGGQRPSKCIESRRARAVRVDIHRIGRAQRTFTTERRNISADLRSRRKLRNVRETRGNEYAAEPLRSTQNLRMESLSD